MAKRRNSKFTDDDIAALRRAARRVNPPRVDWPTEALECGARWVIAGPRSAPLSDDEKAEVEERFPGARHSRLVTHAPHWFWIQELPRLLRERPLLTPEQIGSGDWHWFFHLTSRSEVAHDEWFERVRNWTTEIARFAGEHVLTAFVIAPGEHSPRLHAHGLVSFPPGLEPPSIHRAVSRWTHGRAELADYDATKDGIVYIVEHAETRWDVPSRCYIHIGCPFRGTCRERGCTRCEAASLSIEGYPVVF